MTQVVSTIAAAYSGAVGPLDVLNFVQADIGALSRTAQDKAREQFSVRDFGAKGNGITDDTSALTVAEAAAYAAGAVLLVSPGTYLFNGQWAVRVPISGYGATIKQARGSVDSVNVHGLVTVSASDVLIQGLAVDGNLRSTGFASEGYSRITLRECAARNCVNFGFAAYNGIDITVFGCRASNIRYYTAPSVGAPADGFYFGGCTRARWVNCAADDFRRIGFVSEGNGAMKSGQIQALFCIATNANHCDDSTTEYNAGFWAENTNSVDWLYCTASLIAGNAGQTSGRVAGLWAFGSGNNSRGNVSVIGCRVFGGLGYLPSGITVGGSGTYADVMVADCYVSKSRIALSTGCGLNSLTIRGLAIEDIVNTNGSHGGIVIDGSLGSLNYLEIDRITVTGATWHADAGIVNFFSAPAGCRYMLRNVKGSVPHVMRGAVAQIRAEESEIACGSASGFASFLAGCTEHIDCYLTSRSSASSDYIINGAAIPSGSEWIVRGGHINGFGAWQHEISGTNITTRMQGAKISGFCFQISTVGTFINCWEACEFYGVPPAVGTIRTNYNVPTKQILHVQNSYFESSASADTPIRLWNTAPTNVILHNNTYRTAAALHNLGTVSSAVNNTAV